MREKKPYGERTRLNDSDTPKRKYILAYEGKDTEPIYFNMIDNKKTELGIDSLVVLSPIIRSFSEDGWSHPKKIAEAIVETLEIQKSGDYPYKMIIDWIAEYLNSNDIVKIKCEKIQSELQNMCKNELSVSLSDTIDFENLDKEIERILNCYINSDETVKVDDLIEYAKSIIKDNTITFDPTIDHLCLIVDRDCKSFKSDQYDQVMHICDDNSIDLYVTNPCFEFWLLLHFDDVIDIDQVKLLENKKDNGRTFAEIELRKRMTYTKSSYNANTLFRKIPNAIANEKKFCEELVGLKTSIGSNIGILLSQMQELE